MFAAGRSVLAKLLVVAVAAAGLIACSGPQSALDAGGPRAERIADLWWAIFWLSAAVWIITTGLLIYALARSRTGEPPSIRFLHHLVLWGGALVPAAILVVLLLFSIRTTNAVVEPNRNDGALTVRVIGHMWWWQVFYLDDAGAPIFETANEIRIPAGRPVRLELEAADVIHSFWPPRLAGKLDLFPGRTTTLRLEAERPGVHRGQCAEYCGLQHANMGFMIFADSAEEFDRWLERQSRPAVAPQDREAARGRQVFIERCASCHTIRGVSNATSPQAGPDLTRLASRTTLAAATVPNTKGHLAGWISDPQTVKPGNRMPHVPLRPAELSALLRYLELLE